MVTRGCGRRRKGGTYAVVPTGPGGQPLEHFLQCPPIPVDLDELGISALGVHLVEVGGVHHVLDVVGEEHYPNVLDFVEEARRYGVSRRCEGVDYSKISAGSRLTLIHRRAHIENAMDYYRVLPRTANMLPFCHKDLERHDQWFSTGELTQMCSGLWFHDVESLDSAYEECGMLDGQVYGYRKMPGFTYHVCQRPEGVEPDHRYAIFAIFPLTQFEVVDDPDEPEKHREKVRKVEQAQVPVFQVEE